jgi:NOL1/NOP2/fmu family ribosome biogenesis protein
MILSKLKALVQGEAKVGAVGQASVCKLSKFGMTKITVAVRLYELKGQRCFIRSPFKKSAVVELTPEAAKLDSNRPLALKAFEGYAIDGIGDATKHARNEFGVEIIKFEGLRLAKGWRDGARIATALACFSAMKDEKRSLELEMSGWSKLNK